MLLKKMWKAVSSSQSVKVDPLNTNIIRIFVRESVCIFALLLDGRNPRNAADVLLALLVIIHSGSSSSLSSPALRVHFSCAGEIVCARGATSCRLRRDFGKGVPDRKCRLRGTTEWLLRTTRWRRRRTARNRTPNLHVLAFVRSFFRKKDSNI